MIIVLTPSSGADLGVVLGHLTWLGVLALFAFGVRLRQSIGTCLGIRGHRFRGGIRVGIVRHGSTAFRPGVGFRVLVGDLVGFDVRVTRLHRLVVGILDGFGWCGGHACACTRWVEMHP
jgi:hypothetical protein